MEKLRPGDPEHIGPYEVIARLGAGGMGVVFLGTKGADRVAIKVVRSTFLDDPSLKTRFVREIETLQKVESPYVAKFLDSSVDGEIAWHAVEFVNGPTLKELIDFNGPMAEGDWLTFAGQLRQALDSVHRLGVVHRDIKPANIIMSETGPKLIDFGISQDSEATSITTTGAVAGSPAWLAPEQLAGEVLSPASDLFSAGSVLLFAATGRSPWGQETTMSVPVVYQKILSGDVDFSGLTTSQHQLVGRLLDLNPEARSFTGRQTPGISAQTRTKPVPSSVTQQTTGVRPKRRPKVVAWVVTAVVLLLGGGGGGLWWYFGAKPATYTAQVWISTENSDVNIELLSFPGEFEELDSILEFEMSPAWGRCWGEVNLEFSESPNVYLAHCGPWFAGAKENQEAVLRIENRIGEVWTGAFPLLPVDTSTTYSRVEFELTQEVVRGQSDAPAASDDETDVAALSTWTECRSGLPLIERLEVDQLVGTTADSIKYNLAEFDSVLGGSSIVVASSTPNQPKYALYMLRGFQRSLLTQSTASWSGGEFTAEIVRSNANQHLDLFRSSCAGSTASTSTTTTTPTSAEEIKAAEQEFIDSGKCENVLALFAQAETLLREGEGTSSQISTLTKDRLTSIGGDIADISRELPDGSDLRISINNAKGPFNSVFWNTGSAEYFLSIMEPHLKDVRDSCR